MDRPLVYVAGPIAGQSFGGATTWRGLCEANLPECEILTPMRGKDYLKQFPTMPLTSKELDVGTAADATAAPGTSSVEIAREAGLKVTDLDAAISSEKAIHRRDTWDIERCDIALANLLPGDEANKVSIGTACEVYLMSYLRKPVIEILTRGGIHDHPFITGSA
ncbi:hypothetical protein LCGC14_0445740, partial [marine sediment metagenome]